MANATIPTLSNYTRDFGQTVTINTNNDSLVGIIRHKLSYSFAGNTGNLNSGNYVTASYTWTIPDMASSIPNAASGTCTITCVTYDTSTSPATTIGTKTVNLTLTVPASVVPTISSVTVAEAVTSPDIKTKFSAYVQSKSKLSVSISASGAKGSTISRYQTNVDGASYTGSSVTTNTLKSSGTLTATVTVTDSRGRTATTTKSITVLAYTAPKITSFSAWRADSSGNRSNTGEYVRVTFAAEIASANSKNNKTWTVQYKPTNSGAYANASTATPSSYSFSQTNYSIGRPSGGYNPLTSYLVKLVVTDFFGSVERYVTIPTQSVMLDFNDTGNGLGIGMINQNTNSIDSAWTYRGTGIELSERVTANGDNERWPIVQKDSTGTNNRVQMGVGSTNNALWLRQWVSSSVYENYALPTPSAASSAWYSILTSKEAVTVAQGGTGATDAAAARTNLGLGTMATQAADSYLPTGGGTLTGDLNGTSIKLSGGLREWTDSEIASVYVLNAAGSYSRGTVINSTANRWYFRSWSPNTSYWEQFQLPNPTATSSTTGTTYSILTTKAAVTVGQGGTGATSEAAARTNLGVNGKEWNSSNLGSFNTTAASITLPQAGSWLIITGHNSTASLNSVFMVRTSGNRVWGIASAGTTSGGSTSYTWCGTVGLTASGTAITGITQGGGVNVYGIYLGTI